MRCSDVYRRMSESQPRRSVRTSEPLRAQGVIRFEMPEDLVPSDHPARLLWRVVQTLDLSAFTQGAKALEGHAGRSVLSPAMMLTRWLYAVSIGVGSAREIARRIESDDAFRWIVGDVSVGHHKLSQFRVGHPGALQQLMTDVLGTLMHKGMLSLERVAQDGTRVRAHASAPSFRGESSLLQCREQAALHLKAVLAETDDPEATDAEKASRLAAARDYQARVEAAIETVHQLQAEGKSKPRASTTDADARTMKMPDGGFRPGYNVQMAVAGDVEGGARTIVGVQVTNVGSDMGSLTPMMKQIEQRTGQLPDQVLADSNHAKHSCIETLAQRGVELIMSVPEREKAPLAGAGPAVEQWRQRMETDEAKTAMRARASLCELANAHMKHRQAIAQVLVRGLQKVTSVALIAAISANLLQHASGLLA